MVADEIYKSRKSMIIKGINTPDHRIDLRVSDEDLSQLLKTARREYDPLHLAETIRRRDLMISLYSDKKYIE